MRERPLDQQLIDEPYRFEFFQAVRLLERIAHDRKPVGRDALPHEEVVRFRSRIGMEFPPSELHEIRFTEDGTPDRKTTEMLVNFMGLVGVSGVLPTHYTELVLDRIRHRDTAMWSFLDIFTHRAVSQFFRAWQKYRFPIGYERGDDPFTTYLFDFVGLGTRGLRGRMDLPDERLLPYSGLVAQRPHSSNALENMLSDYFDTKAKLVQFFGQWLALDSSAMTRLGARNSDLARSAIIGSRVWDQQSKFRVRLGPMSFKQFQEFLPNGSAHKPLNSMIRFMVGAEVDFDVQLILAKKQVPGSVLTTRAIRRPMLGWTSYLKTEAFKHDDEQVVLGLEE